MTTSNAPVLNYRRGEDYNLRRGSTLLGWFGLATATGSIFFVVVLIDKRGGGFGTTPVQHWINGTLLTLGLPLIHVVPMLFGAAFALWTRVRRAGSLHYRNPAVPIMFGLFGGFLSPILLRSNFWLWFAAILIDGFFAGLAMCARVRERELHHPRMQIHFKKTCISTGLLLAILIALGMLSAFFSRWDAEEKLVQYMARDVYHLRPFYAPADRPEAEAVFAVHGVTAPVAPAEYPYPWGEVKVRVEGPFIVSADFGWTISPGAGSGAIRHYICIFGYLIEWNETKNG